MQEQHPTSYSSLHRSVSPLTILPSLHPLSPPSSCAQSLRSTLQGRPARNSSPSRVDDPTLLVLGRGAGYEVIWRERWTLVHSYLITVACFLSSCGMLADCTIRTSLPRCIFIRSMKFKSARQGKDHYGLYTAWVCSTWRIADTVDSGRRRLRNERAFDASLEGMINPFSG